MECNVYLRNLCCGTFRVAEGVFEFAITDCSFCRRDGSWRWVLLVVLSGLSVHHAPTVAAEGAEPD